MTAADELYARITARARRAAGEDRPAPEDTRDATSPFAALHASTPRTGVPCESGCEDDAAVVLFVGSGEGRRLCSRCFGRTVRSNQVHRRPWHHVTIPAEGRP